VTSDRTEMAEDRVLHAGAESENRFRIFAVEPHGWSTILIEDQAGRTYLVTTATGRYTEIPAADTRRMVERRDYRPWHGGRVWSTIEELPLVAGTRQRPHPPADITDGDPAYP
jgi:hypothetical protein